MVNKRSRERSANPAGGPAGDRDRVAGDQPDQPLNSPANPNSRSLGATAQAAIEKHWAKAGRHEAAVLKDQDPEELHQMRVALRRLRSAIVGFAVAIDLPKRASERAVGQVARILGELRDLDVMDEALRDRYLQNLPPEEQPLLQTVREELAGQRQKAFGRVSKTLQKREWPAINTALGRWIAQPRLRPAADWPAVVVVPDLLLPILSHWLMHPGWLVQTEGRSVTDLSLLEWAVIHDLRKVAKRVRYQMALFTDFYGSDYEQLLDTIGDIQTVLGDLQDIAVLENFLVKTIGIQWATDAPVWAGLLEQQRDRAWENWLQLQKQFDRPNQRERIRDVVNRPRLNS
ncbi:CHAD domain-containing protein [Limnothrix sp. PR1529]|uniref:CHAD domain-containing protein n=1 Tax=Limnothrix sp. PR1529 TaxID=1704291 RepID=UPI0013041C54|nr:CHAD domain-containing protein [Limnothrix sp. PR1529]